MKCLLTCATLLLVLAVPAARPASQEAQPHEEETELAARMERIEDALKLLRKSMKDEGARAAALTTLAEIQRLTLECKTLEPALAAKLPGDERAALVTAYRRTMVDFLLRQLELEAALLDGDAQAAQAAFERFRDMEDSAHERFAPEEDG